MFTALWPAFALAALTGIVTALKGAAWPAFGLFIGAWLVLGGVTYLVTRARRGGGFSIAKIAALPLAVWSMSAAHLGAGVLTLGAVAETAFKSETTALLAPGETAEGDIPFIT